jgi:hypothetical protein
MTGSGTKRYQIGRDEGNDIVIPHASVSRLHALLDELGGNQYLLTDMNSTFGSGIERNGNWVQIQKAVVAQNDQIRLGDEVVIVAELLSLAGAAEMPAPSRRATTIMARSGQRSPLVAMTSVAVVLALVAGGVWWLTRGKSSTPQEAFVAKCVASGYKTTTCRCHVKVLDARLTGRELTTYAAHMRDRLNMPVTLIAKVLPASGSLRACDRR